MLFHPRKGPDDWLVDPSFAYPELDECRYRRDCRKGALLLAITVTIFSSVIGFSIVHGRDPGLDEALCQRAMPPQAHVMFVVDPSDPLSPIQLNTLRETIRRWTNRLPVGDRLSLLVIRADGDGSVVQTLFSRCKIGDGRRADWRTENPKRLKKRYEEAFEAPLNEAIDQALTVQNKHGEAATSPILEALYEAVNHPSFSLDIQNRVLLLWSDMLQNSPLLTQFKPGYTFEVLERSGSVYIDDVEALAGAEVTVYQLKNQHRSYQTEAHAQFWKRYFEAVGVADYQVRHL